MASNNSYEQQFLTSFDLLVGNAQGLSEREFTEILCHVPNPSPLEDITAAFKRHSDNGKVIDCDCMLEATAELSDSSNASLISMTLVQTIERLQWKKIFNLVDEDGSGLVDIHELKSFVDALATVMSLQGYNTQDAAKMMRESVKGHGSSELDFDSFIVVTRKLTKGTPVITLVDKVEEAKRAVRDRKATALNLFQTRVLTSMLRKRGTTFKSDATPRLGANHMDPFESTARPGASLADRQRGSNNNNQEPNAQDPSSHVAGGRSSSGAGNNNHSTITNSEREKSPASGATYEFEVQQFLRPANTAAIVTPNDINSNSVELARLLSVDPIRNPSGISLESTHQASLGRISAVTHSHDSARIIGLLDQYCKDQDDKKVFDSGKISKQVSELCSHIVEAVNGPPGTLFEMQREAVSRSMEICNDFLNKVSSKPATKVGDISVPNINLKNAKDGSTNNNGRSRTQSVMSNGSNQRSRARTIMESKFGKEQLYEIANDKINELRESRREVAGAQEDIDYAIAQLILPRNKIVEMSMSLIPHARNPTLLANAIRRFEMQTQELHDCLAYFRYFADFSSPANDSNQGSASGFVSGEGLDDLEDAAAANRKSSSNTKQNRETPKFSVIELMKIVKAEKWGEAPPAETSEAFSELMAEATVHVSYVTEHLFRNVSSPTMWIKELSDAAADLAMHVKGLAANYLRDRAVQTPVELIIGLQSFPVQFSMSRTSARDNTANDDDDKNESTLREKRRIALAQARIRRNLVSDITKERAAESVDLLIKRYLSAGVIVPPNFGRVISTDPAKQKRHTFRFGSKLIDLTPMDDRLAVHSCGGFMYFDEFCGKWTDLECKRMQRESKRGNFSVGMMTHVTDDKKYASPNNSAGRSGSNRTNSPTSSISTAMAAYLGGQHTKANNNSRSTSTMTQAVNNNSMSGSPLNLRSNSAYSHTSNYTGGNNSNSTHARDQIVEFTVRSGSPVQVVPFPGLAEANQKSISQLAKTEMNNSSRGGGGSDSRSSSQGRRDIGMVPARELAAQQQREKDLIRQKREEIDKRIAASNAAAGTPESPTAAKKVGFSS